MFKGRWAKFFNRAFYWPSLFKDVHAHAQSCDNCQRSGGISKMNEMPLKNMLEVEVFDS